MTGILEGKKAIITGAASGIGEASAKLFAAEGAKVLAVDLPGTPLAEVHKDTPNIVLMEQDVAAVDAAGNIIGRAAEMLGGIDILFNNAGTVGQGGELDVFVDDDWDFVLSVINKHIKAAYPYLKKSGAGRVINVGSVRTDYADSEVAAYTATKHAVAGLTKVIACELGPHGGTANYLQPGAIVTGITRQAFETKPEFSIYWTDLAPTGRLGTPEDIANGGLFLASEESSFVSGTGLCIDGGATCHS